MTTVLFKGTVYGYFFDIPLTAGVIAVMILAMMYRDSHKYIYLWCVIESVVDINKINEILSISIFVYLTRYIQI
ncbi:hypothetical protein EB118_03590 [bacterium]|nr:hypothetical protein [bacterium]NDC94063.1 hypothetical protein [bacterium]NDD82749.1 hypothetical protein [bacterium]NDG29169.1 hypothetical protein [bacterium]